MMFMEFAVNFSSRTGFLISKQFFTKSSLIFSKIRCIIGSVILLAECFALTHPPLFLHFFISDIPKSLEDDA